MTLKNALILATSWLLLSSQARAQDHGHLNAGAESWEQNSKLNFENAAAFIASSRYVKTMIYSNTGTFASTYNGNISLTVLHSYNALGERVPGSPAPGSFVVVEIVSVTGPEGGNFTFWEASQPKLIVPAGTTNGAFRYELSDAALGAGAPGADPYGHIHGRRFSLDKPGVYTVGLRAVDISTNGVAGGPVHAPSEVLPITFQAGINITSVQPDGEHEGFRVSFGSLRNFSWQLESSDDLGSNDWQPVGNPITGTDLLIDVDDSRPRASKRFYRLKGEAIVP